MLLRDIQGAIRKRWSRKDIGQRSPMKKSRRKKNRRTKSEKKRWTIGGKSNGRKDDANMHSKSPCGLPFLTFALFPPDCTTPIANCKPIKQVTLHHPYIGDVRMFEIKPCLSIYQLMKKTCNSRRPMLTTSTKYSELLNTHRLQADGLFS